jgi:hypothetical protein
MNLYDRLSGAITSLSYGQGLLRVRVSVASVGPSVALEAECQRRNWEVVDARPQLDAMLREARKVRYGAGRAPVLPGYRCVCQVRAEHDRSRINTGIGKEDALRRKGFGHLLSSR